MSQNQNQNQNNQNQNQNRNQNNCPTTPKTQQHPQNNTRQPSGEDRK